MLYTATLEAHGPSAIRYPRASVSGRGRDGFHRMEWGRARVVGDGTDLALWALGSMVGVAEAAAELLRREGVSACVVDARFAKPLDEALLVSHARKLGRIVTLEEGALAGGFGSAVLEALERNEVFSVEVRRLGFPDTFVQHGKRELLLRDVGLTPELVTRRVMERWREHVTK